MSTTPANTLHAINHLADRAAVSADSAIEATRAAANHALDSLQSGVQTAREQAPSALMRGAAKVDALARTGRDKAVDAKAAAQAQWLRANDAARGYVRDEPVKAVLIAAATGAALAALIGWAARSGRGA